MYPLRVPVSSEVSYWIKAATRVTGADNLLRPMDLFQVIGRVSLPDLEAFLGARKPLLLSRSTKGASKPWSKEEIEAINRDVALSEEMKSSLAVADDLSVEAGASFIGSLALFAAIIRVCEEPLQLASSAVETGPLLESSFRVEVSVETRL